MRRFLSLAAVLALVGLTACDSTPPMEATGPTVQFATTGVTVSETDGTVTIPLSLSEPLAQSATVEVLFAAGVGASSDGLEYDVDITGFGEEVDGRRIATVTFPAGQTDASVSFEVVDDGELEAAELAVFALQNAQGVAVGNPREFTVTIGTRPIVDIRALDNGEVITLEGIVTRRFGRYTFIQDGTAGISVFAFEDTDFGSANIQVGDRIQIQGQLDEFGQDNGTAGTGLKQIFVGNSTAEVTEFTILSSGNDLPEAQEITFAELLADGEAYEAELIRVEGVTLQTTDPLFSPSTTYVANDGTAPIDFRVNGASQSGLGNELVPDGPFTYVGVVGQFRGTYQLLPLTIDDLQEED